MGRILRTHIVAALALLVTALVGVAATPPVANAAHPGPDGPTAFAHIDGGIIIVQPGQSQPAQWTEVIRPPTGTTVSLTEPSISPNGRLVAYLLQGPFDTELWLYDRETDQSERVDGGMAGPPSWTPDGNSIIYSVTDGSDLLRKVAIVNINTRQAQLLAAIPTGETAIAPAGDQILYWDDVNDRLGLLDVATGQQRVIFESGTNGIIVGQTLREFVPGTNNQTREVNVIQANWAPNSQGFVFNCGFVDGNGENNGFLCTMNADGTNARVVTGGPFSGRVAGGAFTPTGNQIIFASLAPQGAGASAPKLFVMPSSGMAPDGSNAVQITQGNIAFAHQAPDVGVPLNTTPTPASSIPATPVPGGSGSSGGGNGGGSNNPDADIQSLTPARLLDSRTGPNAATVDGNFLSMGRVAGGDFVELDVTGRGGVPGSGVSAAVLNVTAVGPDSGGFLTIYPCGEQPNASSLNYARGSNRASEVVAKLSESGTVCIFTSRASHLIADVTGYVPDGADLTSVTPARFLDTRPNGETIDGDNVGGPKPNGGAVIELDIAGRGSVPSSGVAAAVLNVTAVAAEDSGFLTVYPCGELPTASALNYARSTNVANEVTAQLTADGTVCVFTSSRAHILVDVTGYTTAESELNTIVPARLLETRANNRTVDGEAEGGGAIPSGDVVELSVAGRAGIPADAGAAVLNITAIRSDGPGFFTVFPCGTQPNASSLNYAANTNTANEIVAKLSSSGEVCIFTSERTEMLVDATGYVE